MTTEEYLTARKSKNWRFNRVVASDSFLNVNRIHPIKQRMVKSIVDAARTDDRVKRIIVFGSSTRYDCDITSDLLPFTGNMRRVIYQVTQGMADVVNYDYLDDTDIKHSVEEGVVVYEHNV